ncbi:hypothetical protein ACWGB8_01705 [Kitasatospora sp. NPDC054939]
MNAWDDLSPRARWFMENFDELTIAEMLASADPGDGKHRYLSTGCLHREHDYCKSNTGSNGQKVPAVCKFCRAPCVCACHRE